MFRKDEDPGDEEVIRLLRAHYPPALQTFQDIVSELRRIERKYKDGALVLNNSMDADGMRIKQEGKGKLKMEPVGQSSEEDGQNQQPLQDRGPHQGQQPSPVANDSRGSEIEVLDMRED